MSDKKTSSIVKRVLLWSAASVTVILCALIVLSMMPHVFIGSIEKRLSQQGIDATIERLDGNWNGLNYTVKTHITSASSTGLKLSNISTEADVRPVNLFSSDPLLSRLSLLIGDGKVDALQLAEMLGNKQSSNTSNVAFLQSVKQWQASCERCHIDAMEYSFDGSLNASGRADEEVVASISDTTGGDLHLSYNRADQILTAKGASLQLMRSDSPMNITDVDASIELANIWRSKAQATLTGNDVMGSLSLVGQGAQQLRLTADIGEAPFILNVAQSGDELALNSERFDMTLLSGIAPLLAAVLPDDWAETLRSLANSQFSGAAQTHVTLVSNDEGVTSVKQAKLSLAKVGIKSPLAVVSNISGTLNYDEDSVGFALTTDESTLSLPSLFEKPFASVSGSIQGKYQLAEKNLILDDVRLFSDDYRHLSSSGVIHLGETPSIDLSGQLEDFLLPHFGNYLPKVFPENVAAWLSKAFIAGKKNSSQFTLKGEFKNFFRNDSFVFTVDSDARDGIFHYLDGNPRVAIDKATVSINGTRLSVDVARGALISDKAKKAHGTGVVRIPLTGGATIENLTHATLNVFADVKPYNAAPVVALAKRSIAGEVVNTVDSIVAVGGKVSLSMQLGLELFADTYDDYSLALTIASERAEGRLCAYPKVQVKKARVKAIIKDTSLESVNIQGTLSGKPISLNITERAQGKGYKVALNGKQQSPLQVLSRLELLKENQAQLLEKHGVITGRSNYRATILFDTDGTLESVAANTDLRGSSINTFGLLTKAKNTALPLSVQYDGRKKIATIIGKRRFFARIVLDNNYQLKGLELSNRKRAKNYKPQKFDFVWSAKKLDGKRLLALYRDWNSLESSGSAQMQPVKRPAYHCDIAIDAFSFGKRVEPLKVIGSNQRLKVESPLLDASIIHTNGHLQADIDEIALDTFLDIAHRTETTSDGISKSRISWANALPAMDVEAKKVTFKGRALGSASIHASLKNGLYSIDQLYMNGENFYIDASGYEERTDIGINTNINLDFKGEKLKKVTSLFDVDNVIDADSLDIELALTWPGGAHRLNVAHSYGSAKVDARNIDIVGISAGVGGVFGLVDVGTIFSRILNDFSGLASSDIYFEEAHGIWDIGFGRISTQKATAFGPIFDIKLYGAADIPKKTFDNVLIIAVPKASNIIPVVGAVAGGLVGIAAGVFMQETIGDEIDDMIGLPYTLSGSWKKPVISKYVQLESGK